VSIRSLTQEDPIGLAGGLNLYGFANGDPVTFSDPFGLCPRNLRDENGNCPGGLSVNEWDQVQQSYPHMSRAVRHRTAVRLMRGQIHGGSLASEKYGETDEVTGREITINRDMGMFRRSVFNDMEQLAKTLIHEDQHVIDLANRPKYLSPGEAYRAAREYYEKRAEAAEAREYVQ